VAESAQPDRRKYGRASVQWTLVGGVSLATLGMIVTISGFLAPSLLLPGIYLIGIGLLVLAAGGILSLWVSVSPGAGRGSSAYRNT
jgi:hypothetical protein